MPMKNGDKFEAFASNAVRNDVWRIWNNQLARASNPPYPAHLRLSCEQINAFENALGYRASVLRTILGDVVPESGKVADRLPGPNDFHFGGLFSEDLPHDFSHFDTCSWLTDLP